MLVSKPMTSQYSPLSLSLLMGHMYAASPLVWGLSAHPLFLLALSPPSSELQVLEEQHLSTCVQGAPLSEGSTMAQLFILHSRAHSS